MGETNLNGKIIGFTNNNILAVCETDLGKAYLDVNDTLDYRLCVGDKIEVCDADWYIINGRIVTILGYKYVLNGILIVHPQRD